MRASVLALLLVAHPAGATEPTGKEIATTLAEEFANELAAGSIGEQTVGQAQVLVNRAGETVLAEQVSERLPLMYNLGLATAAKVKDLRVSLSKDGTAFWASWRTAFTLDMSAGGSGPTIVKRELRVTALFTESAEWQPVAIHVSDAVPDKDARDRAKKGDLPALQPVGEEGSVPEELASVVEALRGKTVASMVSSRADMFVWGSAPGEKRIGGKKTQTAWKAWFKSVTVEGPVRAALATADVGWVMANLTVAKKQGKVAYNIPFRVFLVCEREAKGWRVVQAHLSVSPE